MKREKGGGGGGLKHLLMARGERAIGAGAAGLLANGPIEGPETGPNMGTEGALAGAGMPYPPIGLGAA